MPNIEIALSPVLYEWRAIRERHTTVAVDVLRATTSICAALYAGASEVLPLDTLEGIEAYRLQGYQLATERGGRKIGNAEWGNSPTEYLQHDLSGIRIAFSTTNGTIALTRARGCDRVMAGAFCNLSAIAGRLLREPQDTVIVCSGWRNGLSLEDTIFAGALTSLLCADGTYTADDDAASTAMELWNAAQGDLQGYCRRATHVQRLLRLGREGDVRFVFRQDTCPVVPVMNGQGSMTL